MTTPEPLAPAVPPERSRLQQLTDLGRLGAVVHFAGYVVCLGACLLLVELGFKREILDAIAAMERFARAHVSAWIADKLSLASAGDAGVQVLGFDLATLGSAYLVTKMLSVPRIFVTLAITPPIARRLERPTRSSGAV
jgi:hypothetical protein